MSEYGEKLSASNKENIEKALGELKEAHKNRDIAAIDTASNALNSAWQAASEEMYKATQESEGAQAGAGANGSAQGDQPGSSDDNDVTDVDFEEVKEDK